MLRLTLLRVFQYFKRKDLVEMFQRNIRALVTWSDLDSRSQNEWPHPLRYDNGIFDAMCATFPNHNVALFSHKNGFYQFFPEAIPLCAKGKRSFYTVNHSRAPSPVIDGIVTGSPSFFHGQRDDPFILIFPFYDDLISIDNVMGTGYDRKVANATIINPDFQGLLAKGYRAAGIMNKMGFTTGGEEDTLVNIIFANIGIANSALILNVGYSQFDYGAAASLPDVYGLDNAVSLVEDVGMENIDTPDTDEFVSYLETIPYYPVPEWVPSSSSDIDEVKQILDDYVEHPITEYLDTDTIMNLVSYGEIKNLSYVFDKIAEDEITPIGIITTMIGRHFRELPFQRPDLRYLEGYTEASDEDNVKTILEKPPTEYQTRYNALAKDKKIQPTQAPIDTTYSLGEFLPSSERSPYTLSEPELKEVSIYFDPLRVERITVNGIEFIAQDLHVFYGTQFYDLVAFQTRFTGEAATTSTGSVDIPYVGYKDLKLVRDFLNGRIMLHTFIVGLSKQGRVFLGGEGTFLQFATKRYSVDALNSVFSFGVPLREQLQGQRDNILSRVIEPPTTYMVGMTIYTDTVKPGILHERMVKFLDIMGV